MHASSASLCARVRLCVCVGPGGVAVQVRMGPHACMNICLRAPACFRTLSGQALGLQDPKAESCVQEGGGRGGGGPI